MLRSADTWDYVVLERHESMKTMLFGEVGQGSQTPTSTVLVLLLHYGITVRSRSDQFRSSAFDSVQYH